MAREGKEGNALDCGLPNPPLVHVQGRGEGRKGDRRDRECRLGDVPPCGGTALQSTLDRSWSRISLPSPPGKPEACELVRRGIK